ncbi:MAG: hypothetical protein P8X47_10780 [Ignavibacteriaceae bacterium]|jgi:hypothetical protein
MFKKDPIFWLAAFVFVSALVIYSLTQNQMWLFLLVGSYLLRPTLASLNIAKSLVDERQMSIQYRSGNIAFAAMTIGCIIMAVYQSYKGDHSWEFFSAIVIIGIAAKALSNVFLIGNYRESATKIIMAVGLMLVLFASLENGFSIGILIESIPGLVIIGVGWLSKKYPRTIGIIVLVVTVVLLFIILSKGFVIGQIITAVIISVPLTIAGVSLFVGDRIETYSDNNVTV